MYYLTLALAMILNHLDPLEVWAALGKTAASVEQDRSLMKGQRHSGASTGYSIETISVAGMTIREYVSSDGLVFAVAWRGTGAPDLKLLFGEYFDEYRDGVAAVRSRTPMMRGPLVVKTPNLVVERGGHSRYLWGRAFIPGALPKGLATEDIE